MGVLLHVICLFSLASFNIVSLFFVILITMYLGVYSSLGSSYMGHSARPILE